MGALLIRFVCELSSLVFIVTAGALAFYGQEAKAGFMVGLAIYSRLLSIENIVKG